jgi:cation transport ATPase
MAEEKKESWLNYLALTTVILAVCATLSTFKGGGFSTRSVLSQSHAANQWAYYQAKSIKGYLYELQKEELELELKISGSKVSKSAVEEYEKKIDYYSKNIKRYDEEKAQIQKEAKKYETLHDDAQKHAQIFGIAVIFLQIAILLSSIAALMKKKPVWVLGLIMGAFGVIYFINGFFLFLPVSYLLF